MPALLGKLKKWYFAGLCFCHKEGRPCIAFSSMVRKKAIDKNFWFHEALLSNGVSF